MHDPRRTVEETKMIFYLINNANWSDILKTSSETKQLELVISHHQISFDQ